MDKFINPPDYLDQQRRKIERERDKPLKNPTEPERDVLQFLLQNAPLEGWERDILEIIREEAYYFAPQRQTKVLNEGWAAYWHSKIMTEKALKASEIIDYADHNAGVLATAPGAVEPVQGRHRAAPPRRGALGQGALRQRVERLPEPGRAAQLGQARSGSGARRSSRCGGSTATSRSSTSSSRRTSASRTSSSRSR